jgi:hypothetical protein
MLQDSITIEQRHEKFIRRVCESEIVWGLKNTGGLAITSSNEYEDEDEEPLGIICFWSEKALAKGCAREDWKGYEPVEIQLSEFIENWCIGMANDNLMVGSNFDLNMFGFEIDPLNLIIELGKELKKQNKDIKMKNYQNLEKLTIEIEKILNE